MVLSRIVAFEQLLAYDDAALLVPVDHVVQDGPGAAQSGGSCARIVISVHHGDAVLAAPEVRVFAPDLGDAVVRDDRRTATVDANTLGLVGAASERERAADEEVPNRYVGRTVDGDQIARRKAIRRGYRRRITPSAVEYDVVLVVPQR